MTAGSIQLGRVAGIPVRAHWTILLVAALFGARLANAFGVVAGVIAIVAFFVAILAHEFGHALVARRFGVDTESIDLWALGGVARLDREAPSPRAEALVAHAGPFVSHVIGIVLFSVGWTLQSGVVAWVELRRAWLYKEGPWPAHLAERRGAQTRARLYSNGAVGRTR
jgi:Zn-dependent protease